MAGHGSVPMEVRTVLVPYWIPAMVTAVLPARAAAKLAVRRRRRRLNRCTRCGYDLRASEGRCPECGTEIKTGGG
jgi:hypothetical protein